MGSSEVVPRKGTGDSGSDGGEVRLDLGVVNSAGMRVGLRPKKVNPKPVDDSGERTGVDARERSWPAESLDANCSSVSRRESVSTLAERGSSSVSGEGDRRLLSSDSGTSVFRSPVQDEVFPVSSRTGSVVVRQGELPYRRASKQLIGL